MELGLSSLREPWSCEAVAVKLEGAVLLSVRLLLVVGVKVRLGGVLKCGPWWQEAGAQVREPHIWELLSVAFW